MHSHISISQVKLQGFTNSPLGPFTPSLPTYALALGMEKGQYEEFQSGGIANLQTPCAVVYRASSS